MRGSDRETDGSRIARAGLLAIAVLGACGSEGCATPHRVAAVSAEASDRAEVPGLHGVRSWSDHLDERFLEELRAASRRGLESRRRDGAAEAPPLEYLAISGGGPSGAYGAGILVGWTEAGTRPSFDVVTGISAGALMSPFVFLGPEYDPTLRHLFTDVRRSDIAKARNVVAGWFGDSLEDSGPLFRLLRTYVDQDVLGRIAAEYARGRILLVGTTNLDAQRGVIWNVTAIAASGHPDALRIVQRILLASASIPGKFPPVMIDVEVDGARRQEMHVDGGALSQVFFYPPTLPSSEEANHVDRAQRLYVIRNSRLAPQTSEVERRSVVIAARAIETLVLSQGLGDLYRIYLTALRDGIDFNVAFIPEDFDTRKESFDPAYMRRAFDLGFAASRNGSAWAKKPPGFALPETRRGLTPAPESR